MSAALVITLISIGIVVYQIESYNEIMDDDNTNPSSSLTQEVVVDFNMSDDELETVPDELDCFLNRDPKNVFKDILPMPGAPLTSSSGLQFAPAPPENQSKDTDLSVWSGLTDAVVNFVDCIVQSDDCPGKFEQGKLVEPPDIASGDSLGASITTGIAPWTVVTYLKRGDSTLTTGGGKARIPTDINESHWSSGWQGIDDEYWKAHWISPTDKLGNSEYVAGFELSFALHVEDLVMVSADYRSSGALEIVVQAEDTIAILVEQSCGNAKNSSYNVNQGIMLASGLYKLRVAVKSETRGPAVFWMQGTIATMTPHNLLIT